MRVDCTNSQPRVLERAGDVLPLTATRRAQLIFEIDSASQEIERAVLRANFAQYMGLKLLKSAIDVARQVLASPRTRPPVNPPTV